MICLVIIFIDLFIRGCTGQGFLKEPMFLALGALVEVGITTSVFLLYEAITGKDLL